jgi:hypothetical protein
MYMRHGPDCAIASPLMSHMNRSRHTRIINHPPPTPPPPQNHTHLFDASNASDSSRRVTNSDLTPPILSPRDLSMSLSFPTVNLSYAPVCVTTPPAAATDATSEALVAGAEVCV